MASRRRATERRSGRSILSFGPDVQKTVISVKCREIRRTFFGERCNGLAEFAALNRSSQSLALAVDCGVKPGEVFSVQESLALNDGNWRFRG